MSIVQSVKKSLTALSAAALTVGGVAVTAPSASSAPVDYDNVHVRSEIHAEPFSGGYRYSAKLTLTNLEDEPVRVDLRGTVWGFQCIAELEARSTSTCHAVGWSEDRQTSVELFPNHWTLYGAATLRPMTRAVNFARPVEVPEHMRTTLEQVSMSDTYRPLGNFDEMVAGEPYKVYFSYRSWDWNGPSVLADVSSPRFATNSGRVIEPGDCDQPGLRDGYQCADPGEPVQLHTSTGVYEVTVIPTEEEAELGRIYLPVTLTAKDGRSFSDTVRVW